MSDGCAKGSLRCALGVEVNVLMIAGGIGELINSLLVYLNPVGESDDERRRIAYLPLPEAV